MAETVTDFLAGRQCAGGRHLVGTIVVVVVVVGVGRVGRQSIVAVAAAAVGLTRGAGRLFGAGKAAVLTDGSEAGLRLLIVAGAVVVDGQLFTGHS